MKQTISRLYVAALCIALLQAVPDALSAPAMSLRGTPWPACDDLGRSVPTAAEVGAPRTDRYVGIFYFLWHDEWRGHGSPTDGPYDISKILKLDPQVLSKPESPLWGPRGAPHYWGEPLYGYYRSDDPWVLRRHAHALADAGVDVLIFDTTNALTYSDTYLKLCEVFRTIRQEGGQTPQIAFMVNTKASKTAGRIYREFYQEGLFRELWFQWQDKPLLICDPERATSELRDFFTLRRAHWPVTMVNTKQAWHWEATFPQPYGYVDNPRIPEQVNVSVAQNLRRTDGRVTNMSDGDARGRSFHQGQTDNTPGAVNHGYNFQEQWSRAIELDPPFVMITGWNEWTAGRFARPGKPVVFVDQYDQEHSRDIEFAKHAHFDNYYYQMVTNVRRYKGVPGLPSASDMRIIDIDSGFQQWQEISPEFRDHVGETIPRDHQGIAGTYYRNQSGRNDLVASKVTSDGEFVYFYLRAEAPLQPPEAPQGLWLLVDADQKRSTGWEGYDLVLGRGVDENGRLWLERHITGWQWERVAAVKFRQKGRELHLAVPRSEIAAHDSDALEFDFKWVDNIQRPGDIQDFYLSGDAAPEGRFNYRYHGE